jgi:hypothetical protein
MKDEQEASEIRQALRESTRRFLDRRAGPAQRTAALELPDDWDRHRDS